MNSKSHNKIPATIFLLILILASNSVTSFNIKDNGYLKGQFSKPDRIHNSRLNISLTKNKGQLHGFDGKSHPEVKYILDKGNVQIFLTGNGLVYQFVKKHGEDATNIPNNVEKIENNITKHPKQVLIESCRMDMELIGANLNATITEDLQEEGVINYYTQGILNVHSFKKLTYHEIYPGIDWTLFVKDGELKYEFMVSAGADPALIRLKIKDAEGIRLTSHGGLELSNILGTINEKEPISFQSHKEIKTSFVLKGTTVTFSLGAYNTHEPLIIDPSITWSTYYGGTNFDMGSSTAIDASGNIYMTGNTTSSVSIASGGYQNTYNNGGPGGDAFIVKFNSSGGLIWATYYGGENFDEATSSAVDASGNVYIGGQTSSTANIASGGYQNSIGGSQDAFLIKFSSTGGLIWATYYGGSGIESASCCNIDNSGNVYLVGTTGSTANIASGGYQNIYGGGALDGFLVKFNSGGTRQWATYYGGANGDWGQFSAIDNSGNIAFVGLTTSTAGIASGGFQNIFGGGSQDAYLVKFNSSGVRQWATYYGGAGIELGNSAAFDPSGNVYLIGTSTSTTGISSGGFQNTFGGGTYDDFIVKFNSSGSRQWASYFGGNGYEEAWGCITDASGNIYMSGNTSSANGVASGGFQNTYGGGTYDAFLIKLNSSGTLLWGSYFGSNGDDRCSGTIALNNMSTIFMAGLTQSTVGIASGGYQNAYSGGGFDAFLVEICDGAGQPAAISGPTAVCGSGSVVYSVPSDPSAIFYIWAFPPGWSAISSANSVTANPGNGVGTISVSIYGSCGTSAPRTLQVMVSTSTPLPPSPINGNGTVCANSSLLYSVTPDPSVLAYNWSFPPGSVSSYTGNVATVIPTVTGVISYTATDGCGSVTQSLNVIVNPQPSVSINNATICSGQLFVANPSGASSYSITGNNFTLSPVSSSSYSITGQNSVGCISSNTAVLSLSVKTTPTVSVNNPTVCSGRSAVITAIGATVYSITGSTFTVFPNSNTSYTVTGTATNGCTSDAVSSVSVFATPSISVNGTVICQGNSAAITPSGATNYSINGTNFTVTPFTTTSYSIMGVSASGCAASNTAIVTITVNPAPVISVNNGTICSGNTFTILPANASSYTIQGGNATVTPSVNSTYTVIGTSSLGCRSISYATASVTVISLPTVSVSNGSICTGQIYTIVPSGAVNYTYSGSSSTVSPLSVTIYSVSGSNGFGCVSASQATLLLIVNSLPSLSVNSGSVCEGNTFTLNPTGAVTYTFQNGNAVVHPSITSTYLIIGSSAAGCTANTQAMVTVNSLPQTHANSNTTIMCIGETATLNATGADIYLWNGSIQGSTISISPVATTSYTVVGTDGNNCSASAIITMSVSECSGLKQQSGLNGHIKIFPNPSSGIITAEFGFEGKKSIAVYDDTGKLVMNLETEKMFEQLDLSGYARGIYFVRVNSNYQTGSFRIELN